jgi:hypothetical protein
MEVEHFLQTGHFHFNITLPEVSYHRQICKGLISHPMLMFFYRMSKAKSKVEGITYILYYILLSITNFLPECVH